MNTDTIKTSIQAIVDGLTPLAQKLQVPIEGLWKWAIMHNYAVAFENLFGVIIGLSLLITGIILIKKGIKIKQNTSYEGDGYFFSGVLITVAAILFIGFCGTTIMDRLIAPEWNTAQDIACLIHSCDKTN